MKRSDAVKIIHEILEKDTYGFRDSMTDEQIEAIWMALSALDSPECMICGSCQRFVDEDTEGDGWCEEQTGRPTARIRCAGIMSEVI